MNRDHVVFRSSSAPTLTLRPPAGYRLELWMPSTLRRTPDAVPRRTYEAWWLFHTLRIFKNRDYAVVLGWSGGSVAHRLSLFPGYFRFPFMGQNDLQIGDVWTDPDHRGRGLAAYALGYAMGRTRAPGRAFWYLTHESNVASIRTAERAGLTRWGTAARVSRWGVRLLGHFDARPI